MLTSVKKDFYKINTQDRTFEKSSGEDAEGFAGVGLDFTL